MSSPFTQFRKRQKAYLAVLGVMCMIAFVFGGVTCSSDQPAQANPVAASTKYGDLHESDLAYMRSNLSLVNNFLTGLVVRAGDKSFQSSQLPAQYRNQFLEFQVRQLEQEGLITNASEETAVDVMILANKAKELGVVVSDDAINDFINQQTRKQLSADEIAEEISRVGATQRRLFDALQSQILSLRMRYLFGRGLMATPPAQQWEYYQRLNRRARAEIAQVSVADFVSQVPDPPEQDLRKFFEEQKNRVAQPGSPEPGFKQPHKVALQYLKAEYDKFYNEAEISDEAIAEHYEKNKKNYPYTDPPLEAPRTDEPADKPEAEKKDPETTKPDAKKPAPEKAAPEKPAEKKPAEKPESNDESCQSEVPADGKQPAKEPVATPPSADNIEKPAQKPAEPTPQPTTIEPAATQAEQGPTLLDLSSKYGLPRDIRSGPKPAEAPLWSVTDRIRKELAGQQARKKMEETLAKVRPILDGYYNDYALWKSEHPDAKDVSSRPARPDFMDLAKKQGLSAHEVRLASLHYVLTETDVGQAVAGRGAAFMQQALETPPVYKEQSVQDAAGNQYLYWKSQDVPEHVPNFDDAETRRQVLASWKQLQARDLAQKRAEALAEKARAAKEPLSSVLAGEKDLKVTEAGPFTWMTQGSEFLGPQEPRITSVPGVDTPGTDFMRAVFDLAEDEVGMAFNAPKTAVYVVRVTRLEPPPRVLMEKFLTETPSPQQQRTYTALSFEEHDELSRNWLVETRKTAGLHWIREAYTGALR